MKANIIKNLSSLVLNFALLMRNFKVKSPGPNLQARVIA